MIKQLTDDYRHKQQILEQLCNAWSSEYRQRGGTIYCRKGCAGCCSLAVNCSFPEAALIASQLRPDQAQRLTGQIPQIQQAARGADSLKVWLRSYRQTAGPCPFLEPDGSCGIYAARPLSCRSLLATAEPLWCTTDFSSLSSQEKQRFIESLDRSAVAFPTHYAATPQELGRELEEAALREMETVYGFSIVGLLPWLVWLEQTHHLSERMADGAEAVQAYLESQGLLNPYLVLIS